MGRKFTPSVMVRSPPSRRWAICFLARPVAIHANVLRHECGTSEIVWTISTGWQLHFRHSHSFSWLSLGWARKVFAAWHHYGEVDHYYQVGDQRVFQVGIKGQLPNKPKWYNWYRGTAEVSHLKFRLEQELKAPKRGRHDPDGSLTNFRPPQEPIRLTSKCIYKRLTLQHQHSKSAG